VSSVRRPYEHVFVSDVRTAISELYDGGLSQPEIARRLGLAPPTVSYHVARLIAARTGDPAPACPVEETAAAIPESAHRRSETRDRVAAMLSEGLSRTEIGRHLGVSKQTVTYHARRLGKPIDDRCSRRYDWDAVQRYYDEGHSVRECVAAFGFSTASWSEAVRRGALVARPSATPLSELLVAGMYRGRHNLKLRLIKEGVKENRCERCGVEEWRGEPLMMSLHHVNGDRLDNRLENLEFLCPNCHSQTVTFAGRKRDPDRVPADTGCGAAEAAERRDEPRLLSP
jgi:DNA-binding CsgD family transcriptional regulator